MALCNLALWRRRGAWVANDCVLYLCWQVEREYGKVEYPHAGNDEVDDVEQGFAPDLDAEEDVCGKK